MISASSLSDAVWFKSSYSGNNGGDCLEVANLPGVVPVRDSKRPAGPVLMLAPAAWADFVAYAGLQERR
ncbi:hypothetical protein HY68_13690 [Streptomyces sp. AcH 505]|uniref:DUF397 domain-containing protein n=1 Tax=Streptomyces sp. AcH 505 TaxID=352211 RepID=UPI00059184E2|nr:hypothetical protein HY68_13690 [Streptomyces sp. AcH 505]